MGKRKSSRNADGAMEIFIATWKYLVSLHDDKTRFALSLLWDNEEVLTFFVKEVLELMVQSEKVTKSLLRNGYMKTLKEFPQVFSPEEWEKIHEVFSKKISEKHIPAPISSLMEQVADLDKSGLQAFVEERIVKWEEGETFSKEFISCYPISEEAVSKVVRKKKKDNKKKTSTKDLKKEEDPCFVGDWKREGYSGVRPGKVKFCHKYPTEFTVIEKTKNFTFFLDRSNSEREPYLIGMVFQQKVLTPVEKFYFRSLMVDLCGGHPGIKRKSHSFLCGAMVAHGPVYKRHIRGGGKKISFFTHLIKMWEVLECEGSVYKFDRLLDVLAHKRLLDIVLGLFLWWCPQLLTSFVALSHPYFDEESLPGSIEATLGVRNAGMYQLFVTENFCAELHVDDDTTDYTLCYASHPDSQISSPIDFVIGSHGLRIPICDGDLFCFRSNLLHGTGYRSPSSNKAYVAGVVIPKSFSDLIKRLRCST